LNSKVLTLEATNKRLTEDKKQLEARLIEYKASFEELEDFCYELKDENEKLKKNTTNSKFLSELIEVTQKFFSNNQRFFFNQEKKGYNTIEDYHHDFTEITHFIKNILNKYNSIESQFKAEGSIKDKKINSLEIELKDIKTENAVLKY